MQSPNTSPASTENPMFHLMGMGRNCNAVGVALYLQIMVMSGYIYVVIMVWQIYLVIMPINVMTVIYIN